MADGAMPPPEFWARTARVYVGYRASIDDSR